MIKDVCSSARRDVDTDAGAVRESERQLPWGWPTAGRATNGRDSAWVAAVGSAPPKAWCAGRWPASQTLFPTTGAAYGGSGRVMFASPGMASKQAV
jgi:hypothetical protein